MIEIIYNIYYIIIKEYFSYSIFEILNYSTDYKLPL